MRAWTTFAVGPSPRDGRTLQPLPDSVRTVTELDLPDGANPSKVATWVQRLAIDGVMADDCPDSVHDAVHLGALSLGSDPSQALAIDMTGNPIGDKMLSRLEGTADDRAWLLFGLSIDHSD
jgi:hypothetical protein